MEELIFFAVIIFFSVIDSIARSRKKKQQAEGQMQAPQIPDGWEPEPEEELEAYSAPSYEDFEEDEEVEAEEPLPSYTRPGSSTQERREPSSSEGMIATDIWQEIAGLATGRTSAPTRPAPPPEPVQARPVETHRVHQAHVGYGTAPSTRARSEQDDLDPLAVHASDDALAVRRQLRRQGGHALRQAVILQEVLGPPAALQPDRFED
jgi:hypothetical protein